MSCPTFYIRQCVGEVLDWTISWTDRLLDAEVITSSAWTIDEDITSPSQGFTDDTTTVWFQGGESGCQYTSSVLIETDQGRTMQAILVLKVC